LAEVAKETEQYFPVEQAQKSNFRVTIFLHSQSSRTNMWPCQIELPKQSITYYLLHRAIVLELGNKFVGLGWVFLRDSRVLLVPVIIRFPCVSMPYLVHICFRQYLFLYLFLGFLFSFLFPQKKRGISHFCPFAVRFHP
jgi:hypothetical protein